MKASDLLESLRKRGVRIQARDDRLIIDAPQGVLTVSLRHEIATRKPELLKLLVETRQPFRVLSDGPYAGFFVQEENARPDPVRAQQALAETQAWRERETQWLRDVLRVDSKRKLGVELQGSRRLISTSAPSPPRRWSSLSSCGRKKQG